MLTKRQFISTYNRIKNRKNLRSLTTESLGELYEASVSTKPYFEEKFGKGLSCTYVVETDKEVDNSDFAIPNIGSGNGTVPRFPTLNRRATQKLKEHAGLTPEECKEKRQPDGRKTLKIVNRAIERERRNNTKCRMYLNDYYDLCRFKNLLERYYENLCLTFQKDTYDLTISASPVDFLSLGHNGCDSGSCFAGRSSHGLARLRLPTVTNSFVAILKNPGSKSAVGRCWGFYNQRADTWHVTNFYVRGISKPAFMYLLVTVIDEITGKEHKQIKHMKIASGRGVYNNSDGYMISYKEQTDQRKSSKMNYPNRIELIEEGLISRKIVIG